MMLDVRRHVGRIIAAVCEPIVHIFGYIRLGFDWRSGRRVWVRRRWIGVGVTVRLRWLSNGEDIIKRRVRGDVSCGGRRWWRGLGQQWRRRL